MRFNFEIFARFIERKDTIEVAELKSSTRMGKRPLYYKGEQAASE